MKKIQNLLVAALCGVVVSAFAQTGTPGYATIVRVAGAASYSLGAGQPSHPLVAGKVLPAGAIIHTGDNGVVDMVLGKPVQAHASVWQPSHVAFAPDYPVRGMMSYEPAAQQNAVRLTPDTTLAIDKLTIQDTGVDAVSDTELNLKKGKIFASVKKLTGASQYLIKLPNGIAGVRGTLLEISADGSVAVYESTGGGLVLSLVDSHGTTHTYQVLAGNSFNPATGATITIPQELLNYFDQIFSALQTVYYQNVSVSRDSTQIYISPTHGYGDTAD